MKRILLAVSSLFLAVFICFLGVHTLNKSCMELTNQLEALADAAKNGDDKTLSAATKKTEQVWEKVNKSLEALTKHAETDELEEIIKSLPVFAQQGDRDRLFEETNFAINKLEHIMGNEELSLNNIL